MLAHYDTFAYCNLIFTKTPKQQNKTNNSHFKPLQGLNKNINYQRFLIKRHPVITTENHEPR